MKPSEVRLAIIDDSEHVQAGITELAVDLGVEVVDQAQTPQEADTLIENLGKTGANVVFVDTNLGYTGEGVGYGYSAIDRILEEHPDIHVLSIAGHETMGDSFSIPTVSHKGLDPAAFEANIEAL